MGNAAILGRTMWSSDRWSGFPVDRYRAGAREDYASTILRLATTLCGEQPRLDSDRPELLHLSALLATDQQLEPAIALLRRAIALRPSMAACAADLAERLAHAGDAQGSVAAALCAIQRAPDRPSAYTRLGDSLRRCQRIMEAAAMYREALRLDPADSAAHLALGDLLLAGGDVSAAARAFMAASESNPSDSEAHSRLGEALLSSGDTAGALVHATRAIELDPLGAKAYRDLSQTLRARGAREAAVDVLRVALSLAPGDVTTASALVEVLRELGRDDDRIVALLGLADALELAGRHAEAVGPLREVLARDPRSLKGLLGAGHVHIALGQARDAMPFLSAAIEIDSTNPRARVDMATVHHLLGDADRGWDNFRYFHDPQSVARLVTGPPLWDGSPLNGKTILLWTEMGRGDVVHTLRYVRCAHDLGGRVIVRCHHTGLNPLIARMPEVERVVVPGAPRPEADVQAPLMFFPGRYGAGRSPLYRRVPYLSVDSALAAAWHRRLSAHRRSAPFLIGLSWGGNVETRSAPSRFLPLAALAPIGELKHVRFVSLQHGLQAAELLAQPEGLRVESLADRPLSIDEAAAIIVNLDLVITVDTMIAHLAGALARPVWTLLRYATNWYWRASGEDTIWYPTMRLFRQRTPGDWSDVVRHVRTALVSHTGAVGIPVR